MSADGSSFVTRRIASAAPGVENVTSMPVTPPRTSAWLVATAASAEAARMTATTATSFKAFRKGSVGAFMLVLPDPSGSFVRAACAFSSESHAVFEDSDVALIVELVLGGATARDLENELEELAIDALAIGPGREHARIEVDPARLSTREILVRRDFQRRGRASEGCSSAGREENEGRAGRDEGGGRDLVVAGGLEQGEPRLAHAFPVRDHVGDGCVPALLHAAERFFLERRDAAVLVSGSGVLVDGLTVLDEVAAKPAHEPHRALEHPLVDAVGEERGFGPEHFGNLREDCR